MTFHRACRTLLIAPWALLTLACGSGSSGSDASTSTASGGGNASSTASGSGGAGGAVVCNGSVCEDCIECALDGECHDALVACSNSDDCGAVDVCAGVCDHADQACIEACFSGHAKGTALYKAMSHCIYCQVCSPGCQTWCHF